jgi:hypothetical protein
MIVGEGNDTLIAAPSNDSPASGAIGQDIDGGSAVGAVLLPRSRRTPVPPRD